MKRSSASKVFLPSRPASWTTQDLRTLRELAEQGCSAEVIAKRLRRTVSSVRNKVVMHGFSLTLRSAEPESVADEVSVVAMRGETTVFDPERAAPSWAKAPDEC